ncbi:MAG: hypothetical protein JWN85_3890 [Gammaproteobacteria bacterium]|nr:hypothetical protein [Gammaproteobacteria bacterium]
MEKCNRCTAAVFVRYFLCALTAAVVAGCGGDVIPTTNSPTTQAQSAPSQTPPSISGTPPATVVAGTRYSFQPSAADTNGDALTFSVENMPAWGTFDPSSGLLAGTPAAGDVGTTAQITISVSDGQAITQLAPFVVQVTAAPTSAPAPVNSPPQITAGQPATSVQAGAHYAFQPSATDPEGDALTFSITGTPAWAAFNTSTGLLSGTPSTAEVGTYPNITISVSDGQHTVSLAPFTIQVTAIATSPPANTPPKISGQPATSVQAGSKYSFAPAASDADGNPLTFSISNKPAWATFSASTGQLSGTPASTNVGPYASITIGVSDGKASVSLPSFSIQVTAAPNSAPMISGTPATQVQAGHAYSFTPTASDANGDTLSFSVQNKPSWASFSIATGQVSGTPASTNVGTYANIVVSVSDGKTSAALAGFTITVTAATVSNGSATLRWVPPTQNTDGTAITNLAGYHINYGNSASSLTQSLDIPDPTATSGTVQGLTSGTWYFALASYNGDGTSSALTTPVSKFFP